MYTEFKYIKMIFIFHTFIFHLFRASQVALVVKNLPANAGDVKDQGSIPGLRRFPGEGNVNPLQYSHLENPMDSRPGGLQPIGSQRVEHD